MNYSVCFINKIQYRIYNVKVVPKKPSVSDHFLRLVIIDFFSVNLIAEIFTH